MLYLVNQMNIAIKIPESNTAFHITEHLHPYIWHASSNQIII